MFFWKYSAHPQYLFMWKPRCLVDLPSLLSALSHCILLPSMDCVLVTYTGDCVAIPYFLTQGLLPNHNSCTKDYIHLRSVVPILYVVFYEMLRMQ
jgi:hypothetical protein